MKKKIEVSVECFMCKNKATTKDVVAFSRYCKECKKREVYYFCSDGCFEHFLEHARKKI